MSMSLRDALGGVAAIGAGLMAGQRSARETANAEEDRAWMRENRDRQRQQWSDADKHKADLSAADQAFKDALEERRRRASAAAETPGARPTEQNQLTVGAAPGQAIDYGQDAGSAQDDAILARRAGMGAQIGTSPEGSNTLTVGAKQGQRTAYGADQGSAQNDAILARRGGVGASVESTPAPPRERALTLGWRPGMEDLLAANDARVLKLHELGRHEEAWKDWTRGAAERAKVRQQAVYSGMSTFKMTGDPTQLIEQAYPLFKDGQKVQGFKPGPQSPTGDKTWDVTFVDERSGQSRVERVSAAEIMQGAMLMADPEKSMAYEAKTQMAELKGYLDARRDQAKGEAAQALQGVKNSGAAQVARINADGRVDAAQVRASAPRAGTGAAGSVPKPMPAAAVKLEQEERDALAVASSLDQQLDHFQGLISSGKLHLSPLENAISSGRNATGFSNENSRNYASFKATLEKLRNDSLRLNKGVQTEGDSQRAWNELVANINDPQVVSQRLQEIRALNVRAMATRKQNIVEIRANYGHETPDLSAYTQGSAQGGAGPRQISSPDEYHALPSGTQYIDPNGHLRTKR